VTAKPDFPVAHLVTRDFLSALGVDVIEGRGFLDSESGWSAARPPHQPNAAIRRIVTELDPRLAPDRIATMEDIISNSILQPRFYAGIFGLFALIAGTLAVVGIYGGVAFAVSSRTREIGIRMALGASKYQVFRAIAGDMLMLTTVGIAGGVAGGAMLTRYLEQMLFEVTPSILPSSSRCLSSWPAPCWARRFSRQCRR
jgi:predicted lysophospholipase L1 biosynthesis ABC-type transport system permease subunit